MHLWIVLTVYIVTIVVFAMVYYFALPQAWTTAEGNIGFDDALFISTSSQTLLGHGILNPINTSGKILVMIQGISSFILLLVIAWLSSKGRIEL